MAREPTQDMAGVLFAAPAGGERWGGFEPHARVAGGELGDDPRGAVGGMIVDDDYFETIPRIMSKPATAESA